MGVDVDTFEEGLKDAFYMNPNILFVGHRELIQPKELEYILMLAENTLLILNLPTVDKAFIELSKPLLRAWVHVESGMEGTVCLSFKDTEPQAQENH